MLVTFRKVAAVQTEDIGVCKKNMIGAYLNVAACVVQCTETHKCIVFFR